MSCVRCRKDVPTKPVNLAHQIIFSQFFTVSSAEEPEICDSCSNKGGNTVSMMYRNDDGTYSPILMDIP